ncbi:CBS domain-containing protein [Candidatus Roizmanbacteria bacterium]|nr:CBS domain-containing protein [Candidatus Roizmanbacteria bacterium]
MRLLNILKETNIIKVSPDSSLSSVLSKLSTSHDAGFVFDDKEKFLGLISPYYSAIKSSHPGNAKVINCLTHPPKIYLNYPIAKVCELFIQSKIHYLPVFNQEENFLGIISVRRVLSHFKNLPIFKTKIEEIVKNRWRPLVTIRQDANINDALHLFKTRKFSKLVVVDYQGKLKGVLSYYDIVNFIIGPKSKEGRGERVGNKERFYNLQVKTFAKSYVLTLGKERLLTDAIDTIISKKIGSVIVVDKDRLPIDIVTSRDLLQFYINKEKGGFFKQVSSSIGKLLSR